MYDITRLKNDMSAALHGTTLNQISNLNGLLDRAARDVLSDCDPNETMRFSSPVALHTGVYSYSCPSDLKGNRIFDIRPQVRRWPWDNVLQTFSKNFDLNKQNILNGVMVNTSWNQYVKSLQIAVDQQPIFLLNSCDTYNVNGTWAAGTNVSDIATDNLNFVEGTGSVKFTLAASGYLENSTMNAIDLSTLDPEGTLYLWFWLPSGKTMTSVSLRWGSSSSDYWEASATEQQDGTAFTTGWNLLAFTWPGSDTGSPDASSVSYLRVSFVTADTNLDPVRIDAISGSLGTLFEVGYYSKCLFRDSTTGAFQEQVTSDTNLINLDTDSYQIYFNRCMVLACQQKQGVDALAADLPFFQQAYTDSLNRYQVKYPSQTQKTSLPYYGFRKQSYSKYLGRSRWL